MESQVNYWLVACPSALVFVALFIAPMAFFVVLSFGSVEYFELGAAPTLANYRDVFVGATPRRHGLPRWFVATATALLDHRARLRLLASSRASAPAIGLRRLLFIVLITLFGGYLMKIYALEDDPRQ